MNDEKSLRPKPPKLNDPYKRADDTHGGSGDDTHSKRPDDTHSKRPDDTHSKRPDDTHSKRPDDTHSIPPSKKGGDHGVQRTRDSKGAPGLKQK